MPCAFMERLVRDSAAKHHDAQTLDLRRTVPGLGKMRSRGLRYASHDIERCPRVHDVASSGRLVTCATQAAGKRAGTAGTNLGQAPLTWAFSEAAVVCGREHPAGHNCLARWETNHRPGHALTILAHQWARAVADMCKRNTACERPIVLHASRRGGGELNASLDSQGMRRVINARHGVQHGVFERPCAYRSFALRPTVDETPTPAPPATATLVNRVRVLRRTRACTSLGNVARVSRRVKRTVRGHPSGARSQRTYWLRSAIVVHTARAPQYVCGAATVAHQHVDITSGHAADCQRCQHQQGGAKRNNPLTGYV
jgi:hypothetical protein